MLSRELISHVSYSLLLTGIHVIAPLSRLATKRPDWPVTPTPSRARKRFHVPQPTFLFPLRISRNMLHGFKDNSVLAIPSQHVPIYPTVSQLFEPQVPKIVAERHSPKAIVVFVAALRLVG